MEDTFGIPSIVMADGPGGIRVTQQFEATNLETGEKTTVYHFCTAWPVGTLLAQSFDPKVLEQVGQGMAKDLQALQIALVLGPGINIQRDPMCGRNFEYYSEDPLVAGKMAAAMIQGIQSLPGCGGLHQTLCRQQPGAQPPYVQFDCRTACTPGNLPGAVQNRHRRVAAVEHHDLL